MNHVEKNGNTSTDALKPSARQGTVARAFWWGFHIQISHDTLVLFTETLSAIAAVIGSILPSPWSRVVAIVIQVLMRLLKGLDRGRGVYIRMLWVAPGIFVPTA